MVGAGIEDVNHELNGGISSELSYGGSFEEPSGTNGVSGAAGSNVRLTWDDFNSTTVDCSFAVVTGDAVTGLQSQSITSSPSSSCSIVNRGLDASGLSIAAGMAYTATVYARALAGDVTLTACIVDEAVGTQLACASAPVQVGDSWTPFTMTLTPTASTSCSDTASPRVACIANPEGVCIVCSGALTLTSSSSGSSPAIILLDAVSLLPDLNVSGVNGHPWRRDVSHSIAAIADPSSSAPSMNLNVMRLGGSMILAAEYLWKRFRGPPLLRQPYTGIWYPYTPSAFGLFDFLALCEDTGMAACVVTMNSGESGGDVADLMQYAYGDASSSVWAAQRAADGRLEPYAPFIIEIGNEQDHTSPAFIADVTRWMTALNASFPALGATWTQGIIIGATPGFGWQPSSVDAMVAAVSPFSTVNGGLFRIMWDFHINGDDPVNDPPAAQTFIAAVAAEFAARGGAVTGVVLEENGQMHNVQRALGHAAQSNRLHCAGNFISIDSAANGLQVQSRNDNSWDQGQAFFTQNETFLSPHGVSQSILAASVARLNASSGPPCLVATQPTPGVDASLDVIALTDAACTRVHVRAVNVGGQGSSINVTLLGCTLTSPTGSITTMSGALTDVNTPSNPTFIAPVTSAVTWTAGAPDGASVNLSLPAYSFSLLEAMCTCSAGQTFTRSGALPYPTTCDGSA